jgi:hypothetical protein
MKKSYRLAQEANFAAALKTVRVTVRKVTVHLDGSATVKGDEKVANAIRRIPGAEVLSAGGGSITFRVPTATEYHAEHAPRMSQAEKDAAAAEKAQRKAERAAKRAEAQVDEDGAEVEETEADEDVEASE